MVQALLAQGSFHGDLEAQYQFHSVKGADYNMYEWRRKSIWRL